jgi:hypothetical protein
MKSRLGATVATLVLGFGYARAQMVGPQSQAAQPAAPMPNQSPPAPPQQVPSPPAPAQPVPAAASAANQAQGAGQWVYTAEYGWLWMPYGSQYTHESADTGIDPDEYAYEPAVGWTWLSAPWLWGWGAAPYYGAYGPWHYPWYGRLAYGWRHPGYGNGLGVGRGYRGSYGVHPGFGGYRPTLGGAAGGYRGYVPRFGRPGGTFGTHGGGFGGGHFGGGHVGGGRR